MKIEKITNDCICGIFYVMDVFKEIKQRLLKKNFLKDIEN